MTAVFALTSKKISRPYSESNTKRGLTLYL